MSPQRHISPDIVRRGVGASLAHRTLHGRDSSESVIEAVRKKQSEAAQLSEKVWYE